jgi:hypothetical protein
MSTPATNPSQLAHPSVMDTLDDHTSSPHPPSPPSQSLLGLRRTRSDHTSIATPSAPRSQVHGEAPPAPKRARHEIPERRTIDHSNNEVTPQPRNNDAVFPLGPARIRRLRTRFSRFAFSTTLIFLSAIAEQSILATAPSAAGACSVLEFAVLLGGIALNWIREGDNPPAARNHEDNQ